MRYFTEDFVQFFKDLAVNNHKDWFHENKKRYETSVKKPFYAFIDDLILEVKKEIPDLDLQAKNCVARINRDIRFSKDKTPYNIHFTGFVSEGGRKDSSKPGIGFRFSPESVFIMGGCYSPDKDQIFKIRSAIAKNPAKFKKVLQDARFKDKFGHVRGEVNKRIDKQFAEAASKEPLLFNKQFYYLNELDVTTIVSDNLLDIMMAHWHAATPVNNYLKNALK